MNAKPGQRPRYDINLLQLGTFLEYFDLMLYVHMAAMLNEIFFAFDANNSNYFAAIAFCSTFIFRPFGALIFGYLGDNVGRKTVIVITTFLMAFSSIAMANLPSYEQIGVYASWAVTLCRIMQGLSSMGEKIGADLYLVETTNPPKQYFVVALSGVFAALGTTFSLIAVYAITLFGFSFRWAFWIGGIVGVVGFIVRIKLKESPAFLNAQKVETQSSKHQGNKALVAYLLIDCVWPIIFYLVYIYSAGILSSKFSYSSTDVIWHNFKLSIIELISLIAMSFLTYKIHPLKILKVKFIAFSIMLILYPYFINYTDTPYKMLLLQGYILIFAPTSFPAASIFMLYFPIKKRFTYVGLVSSCSRALVYPIISFGFIYAFNFLGDFGIFAIMIPALIGFAYGLWYFDHQERLAGRVI
jgi:MFS family permease